MQQFVQRCVRRAVIPVLALATLALGTSAASALTGQPKPAISAEAERTPQGARIIVKGKNWPAKARVKVTGSRPPGANGTQDLGMIDADDQGAFTLRKTLQCSTNLMDDAQREQVTFTAVDSATTVKATARVEGGAWVCQ